MIAGDKVSAIVEEVVNKWHPELSNAKVQIGVLFIISAGDSPPLKENGHPVEGTIKIVSVKDRVTKKFDVEMVLDGFEWHKGAHEHRIALVDHLISRLEIKKPKPKKNPKRKQKDDDQCDNSKSTFLVDSVGRPALKIRKGDWNAGIGFHEVAARHGSFSIEQRNLAKAKAITTES